MKKNNMVMGMVVVAGILSTTVFAEYIYLKKVFKEKYAAEVAEPRLPHAVARGQADTSGAKADADLRAVLRAKDRKITELEKKMKKTAQYARVVLMSTESGDKSVGGGPGISLPAASLTISSRKETGNKLEAFAAQFTAYIEDDELEEFNEEFGALINSLRTDPTLETLPARKANMLAGLQEQFDGSESEKKKEMLTKRMEAINSASEADLEGILNYYQRLDDIKALNKLMGKYNIAREELRDYGIEPPPRNSWGPDMLEMAMNLDNYTAMYKPLVPGARQEQFAQDFSTYLDDLTKRYTKEEIRVTKNEWMTDLRAKYETSTSERDKKWLLERMNGLEKADLNDVSKYMKHKKMGELYKLTNEYGMPYDEMRQGGVILRGRDHGHGNRGRSRQ